jgi:uncharacterized protein YfiM (DUF2279 family)
VKAKGHNYEWTYNDNGTHTGICRNDRSEVVTEACNTDDTVVAPTCTEAGYTEHTCKTCNATYRDSYVEKLGHDYVWTTLNDGTHSGVCSNNKRHTVREACNFKDIVTKPTCSTNGYTTHTCTVCGYSYVDSATAMLGHNHVYTDLGNGTHRVTCKNDPYEVNVIEDHSYTTVVTKPTCSTQGYTTHTCKLCGYSYKDSVLPKLSHDYVYTADDNNTHTGVCKNDKSHTVQAKHEVTGVVTKPTCTDKGYTTYTCKVCGKVYKADYVSALGHNNTKVVTKATCLTEGYTTYTCARCGLVTVGDVVKAKGHSYKDVVTAPTCTQKGYTTHTCTECGKVVVDTYVKATGHSYKDVVTKPTCLVGGYTTHTCKVCGVVVVDSETKATGHSYKDVVTKPTCTQKGYTTHTCINCGKVVVDTYTKVIEHSYKNVVTKPTCTEKGYTTHTCKVCGKVVVDTYTKVKAHNYKDVVTKPTCTKKGYTTHTCKDCGKVVVDSETDMIAHKYKSVVTKPTCTKGGYTTKTCKVCGKVVTTAKTKKLGHSYEWIIDREAEVGVAGKKHQQCTVCGAKKKAVTIPAKTLTNRLILSVSSDETVQTLTWNAVEDADKYLIFGAVCGQKHQLLATVSGDTTSWTRTGLKTRTYYKYYVKAFNTNASGKAVKIAQSNTAHGTTRGGWYTNPTSVKLNKSSLTVAVGKTASVKATVSDYRVDRHIAIVSYLSSNSNIATVDKSTGTIKGVKKGTCYVYAVTQNGLKAKCKVTVK